VSPVGHLLRPWPPLPSRVAGSDRETQRLAAKSEKRALRSDERVVLTVAEVEQMEKLSWVSRCAVTAYDEDGGAVVSDALTGNSPVSSLNSPLAADYSSAATSSPASSVNPCSPPSPFRLPLLSHPVTLAPPSLLMLPLPTAPIWGQIHCLLRGELGRFGDAGWDLSLVARVSQYLRPRGTLAQGDCGPGSASMAVLGEAATALDAVAMRMEVLQYMLGKQGRAAYAFCQENEKEQPGRALEEVIEKGRAARDWVGQDCFTCFGSTLDFNVFVLSKLIRREQPVEVTYGIRLWAPMLEHSSRLTPLTLWRSTTRASCHVDENDHQVTGRVCGTSMEITCGGTTTPPCSSACSS
jgi:hypothetical protein